MSPATFEAAIKAPMHPALRWTPVFAGHEAQHRRTPGGDTACGLPGPLTLADLTAQFCSDGCWGL